MLHPFSTNAQRKRFYFLGNLNLPIFFFKIQIFLPTLRVLPVCGKICLAHVCPLCAGISVHTWDYTWLLEYIDVTLKCSSVRLITVFDKTQVL